MSDTDASTLFAEIDSESNIVGLVLHKHGALRLFRNGGGRFFGEVIGMQTPEGREFLSELGQLEDIACEVLVTDDPTVYGAPEGLLPRLHRRRPS